ncbi:MAG: hypothetical protein HYV42_05545 [Candidatus Magasanikbacteria bacterium]|nr:hypothetical protein [Candidatus Magasanikbacteria bacterium]
MRSRAENTFEPRRAPEFLLDREADAGEIDRESGKEAGKKELVGAAMVRSLGQELQNKTASHYGPVGLQVFRDVMQGKKSWDDFAATVETLPDFREFQNRAWEYLRDLGIVEHQKGHTIVDLEELQNLTPGYVSFDTQHFGEIAKRITGKRQAGERVAAVSRAQFKNAAARLIPFKIYFDNNLSHFLQNAFHGKSVISRDDWQARPRGKRSAAPKPKPLFYSPANASEAFSAEKIKQADFYLGAWEVAGGAGASYTQFQPELPHDETSLACLIYHPRYGNGERNNAGNLVVTYKNGSSRQMTNEWLNNCGYYKGNTKLLQKGEFFASAATALQDGKMPQLTEHGLLRPEDFHISATVESSRKFGIKRPLTQSAGMVVLNERIRYTLGREYGGKRTPDWKVRYHACQISNDLGGITEADDEGKEKLVAIFDLVHAGDPRLKPVKAGQATYFTISKDAINVRPYNEQTEEVFTIKQSDETAEEHQVRAEAVNFSTLMEVKKEFAKEAHISLDELDGQEQAALIEFFRSSSSAERKKLYRFAEVYKHEGLRTFLAFQFDKRAGDAILSLQEQLRPKQMEELISVFNKTAAAARSQSKEALALLSHDQTVLNAEAERILTEGLLFRAKDILITALKQLPKAKDKEKTITRLLEKLAEESALEQSVAGLFTRLVDLFKQKQEGAIDITRYVQQQEAVLKAVKEQQMAGLLNRTLQAQGELAPIPEIHWRVDRSLAEYRERLGFDVTKLLKHLAESDQRKVLLEFGPGSGRSKQERSQQEIDTYYQDIALTDRVYYPLADVIERIVDWARLEQSAGKLTDEEKKLMADMLYKLVLIKDGQIGAKKFEYATGRQERITADPTELPAVLEEIAPQVDKADSIPDIISSRDENGQVYYPGAIDVSTTEKNSKNFLAAKKLLGRRMQSYIRQDVDLYDAIPAYPPGVIIGDFGEISKLKNGSIDVAMGVRSTVYKRDRAYIAFLQNLSDKLKTGGIYLDDNVRDNDGWRSRIAEVVQLRDQLQRRAGDRALDIEIQLILGPGFRGEDAAKGEVPRTLVMSKKTSYAKTISRLLDKGFRLVSLDDYLIELKAAPPDRLHELDPTNQLLKTVAPEVRGGTSAGKPAAASRRTA